MGKISKTAYGILMDMKGGSTSAFTIVETMIVLAVTSFIILLAFTAMQGKTGQAEFTQAINDIQSHIQEIISYSANGYYPTLQDFRCYGPPYGRPTIWPTSSGQSQQGTNAGCSLLGNALQLNVGGNPSDYSIYTIVGRQCIQGQTTASGPCASPTTFGENSPTDAFPVALAPAPFNYCNFNNFWWCWWFGSVPADDVVNDSLEYGLEAGSMYYYTNGSTTPTPTSVVAFLANAGSLGINSSTGAQSGSENIGLYAITPQSPSFISSALQQSESSIAYDIDAQGFIQVQSVTMCFNSGTTDQSGVITIGGKGNGSTVNGSSETVQLSINTGKCS